VAKTPTPISITRIISERAVQIAREDVRGRGWKSSGALQPDYATGRAGIRSTVRYLIIQNRGFSAFTMWWAEGRKVPITDADGSTHVVTGKGVGTPGWVTLPGGVKKWRDVRWQHPGLKPKNFLEKAMAQARVEAKQDIKATIIKLLAGREDT
jgi:hypothetical protein